MKFARRTSARAPALALTSMLDVIFLLLCFFIGILHLILANCVNLYKMSKQGMAFEGFFEVVPILLILVIGIAIFSPSKRAIVYCVGAFLFTVSDVILIFNTFSGVTKFSMRIANLSLYYVGQILIACSLFL